MNNKEFEYDIALSFAGEDRLYVEKVFNILKEKKLVVFYDKDEDLWGKDLYQYFNEVFKKQSKSVVIFISQNYAKKYWTSHELKSAQARAFKENREYILPVRFDETEIPGINETIGYIDARIVTPEQLCEKILIKLGKMDHPSSEDEKIFIPKIRKIFSDIEKDNFLKESYGKIKDYFRNALNRLEASNESVKTSIEERSNNKFISRVFISNELKIICIIWIGDGISLENSICYLEGDKNLDVNINNVFNDYATLEDNGIEMYFKISGMGYGIIDKKININHASSKDLAIYFWNRFTSNL